MDVTACVRAQRAKRCKITPLSLVFNAQYSSEPWGRTKRYVGKEKKEWYPQPIKLAHTWLDYLSRFVSFDCSNLIFGSTAIPALAIALGVCPANLQRSSLTQFFLKLTLNKWTGKHQMNQYIYLGTKKAFPVISPPRLLFATTITAYPTGILLLYDARLRYAVCMIH